MRLSSEKKKELQAEYKLIKPEMGLLAVINKEHDKYFLITTQNLKGKLNSVSFQLKSGGHFNKVLQKDWQELGEEKFEIKVLEQVEYDEDEGKTDYTEELELLKMMWEEKLAKSDVKIY